MDPAKQELVDFVDFVVNEAVRNANAELDLVVSCQMSWRFTVFPRFLDPAD